MVEIPPNVSIPLCIEQGSIYHYEYKRDRGDGTSYIGNRFFIVLNVNPKTDEVLILTTITTKITNQRAYIKQVGEDPDTLVPITKTDFARLSADSVVNCNNIYPLTLDELISKIHSGGKIFYEKLPNDVINALISGVLKSSQVSPGHKKLVI